MSQVYCGSQSLLGIEAIVFDKDGTLADSGPFLKRLAQARSQRCVEAVAASLQIVPSDLLDRFLAALGVWDNGLDPDGLMAAGTRQSNREALVDALTEEFLRAGLSPGLGMDALVADQFDQADRDLSPKAPYTPPFPGTQAMLQRLRQGEIKLGVLSSDSPANVADFLHHYDLMPWVNDWQGTAPDDNPKPAPELLYRLCDRMGVVAARTLVVGDSWVDQALAKQAGAAGFISVSEPWGRPPVAGASLILGGWEDLKICA